MKTIPEYKALSEFDRVMDRTNTASVKWDRYKDRDIIAMWLADMDFRSPEEVITAITKRAEHGVFGYTNPGDELIETVTETLHRDYQWEIKKDWLVWIPGLGSGINIFSRAFGEPGDEIITAIPAYPPFLTAPDNSDKTLKTWPMAYDPSLGKWSMNLEALESRLSPKTKSIISCNPHNPTGRSFTTDELRQLAVICERNDLIICSDEIHCGLILDRDKRHIPIATLDEQVADRTVTFMAPSKTYNLPGLGCSFAVISNIELRRSFQKAMKGIVPGINIFGYVGALAAYKHGERWRERLLNYLRKNRDITQKAIDSMEGLSMAHVEATYLAWIDCRAAGLNGAAAFFEKNGVGLGDGVQFHGPGFVRLNFGCPTSVLNEALSRMENSLTSIKQFT